MSARTRPRRMRRIMSQTSSDHRDREQGDHDEAPGPGVTSVGSTVCSGVGVAVAACARAASASCMGVLVPRASA